MLAENETDSSEVKISKCGHARCRYCKGIVLANNFKSSATNKEYNNITEMANCNSKNVIYLITCNTCQMQYVGETGRALKERLNNHRSDIKHAGNYTLPVNPGNLPAMYR
jgi:sulfur relay (sulfurtransferase) complex TusBCD TusD component (DsrE family)